MKTDIQLLHSVWKSSKEFITQQKTSLDAINLDEVIASVFCAGPTCFFVVDFANHQLDFTTPNITEITGVNPENITFNEIIAQLHPDDMPFVTKAEAAIIHHLYHVIGKEKVVKYKASYCFRAKSGDGSYKMFLHQALILTTDEDGRFGKSLNILTDISQITSTNLYKVSLIGLLGEPSYLDIDVGHSVAANPFKGIKFSKREIEIIRLIAEGNKIKEIADKLFISFNTVTTHKKNILSKSNAKTTTELIAKCIQEGWI